MNKYGAKSLMKHWT